MTNKHGLQPPSTIMILIGAIILLAVIIILALIFKQQIGESGLFNYATDWSGFKWG
ncbi:MAG: hypothetical protein PHC66_03745 [Candidatus Nanoarchaeia archaeon]|nr:hypothetical protein [Candidatus Nanoarchaeia archaeon]MDD5239208.1 hypothetical protein [Candidatus Nanoarchaeia archaeon]